MRQNIYSWKSKCEEEPGNPGNDNDNDNDNATKNLAILAASALSWLEFTIQLSLFPCQQNFNIK